MITKLSSSLTYTRQYMISIIKRTTDADHAFVIENGMGPIWGEGMAYYRDAPHPHVFLALPQITSQLYVQDLRKRLPSLLFYLIYFRNYNKTSAPIGEWK